MSNETRQVEIQGDEAGNDTLAEPRSTSEASSPATDSSCRPLPSYHKYTVSRNEQSVRTPICAQLDSSRTTQAGSVSLQLKLFMLKCVYI